MSAPDAREERTFVGATSGVAYGRSAPPFLHVRRRSPACDRREVRFDHVAEVVRAHRVIIPLATEGYAARRLR
jgi:hypothetical protein